jgi:hypothetical protein
VATNPGAPSDCRQAVLAHVGALSAWGA